jgi:hypothetical protein
MTTQEAITEAKNNIGEKINLLSLSNTYIYTRDGIDFSLIIEGAFSLGFQENHASIVEDDVLDHTSSINWLGVIKTPDVGTTKTYEAAVKKSDKRLRA